MEFKYYFNFSIDENYSLHVEDKVIKPNIRKISDLKPVLLDTIDSDSPAYFMYRNIYLEKDKEKFEKNRIRFDITLLLPIMLGREYNKTFGHYHPKINNFSYPEIYEVINGKAKFILQSDNFDKVFIINAKKGDHIFIFPNFGHVTVNIGEEPLVLSNLVYSDFESDYSIFREKRGAMIYITKDGIIKNENYNKDFEITELEAKRIFNDLYEEYIEHPQDFNFLKEIEL